MIFEISIITLFFSCLYSPTKFRW